MIYDLIAPVYDEINKDIDYSKWADFIEDTIKREYKEKHSEIDEVMEIKGLLVHITEDMLKSKLIEDEYLVRELLNLDVFDTDGNKIGRVSDLGENKANDLLEIEMFAGPLNKARFPSLHRYASCTSAATCQ